MRLAVAIVLPIDLTCEILELSDCHEDSVIRVELERLT